MVVMAYPSGYVRYHNSVKHNQVENQKTPYSIKVNVDMKNTIKVILAIAVIVASF